MFIAQQCICAKLKKAAVIWAGVNPRDLLF